MIRLAAILSLVASAALAAPGSGATAATGPHLGALVTGGLLGALFMAAPSLPRPPRLLHRRRRARA
ncbi:hypothetical protein [Wenxinia marina]|uniref:Uncharacterized protein n=1 Tax=Wenxinia marina DSM 24838 TaxID=1123501 RepID=A0A0D0PZ29_9RHOB|nr:hypothetical protein [Wenxinia marina]KIQ67639.1 hypothetical protein Wenmar_03768 [Wenxinia marina DSM 24838]GGL80068.1 hypothetical protein GCM10011392_38290 [Wenxinia marina]